MAQDESSFKLEFRRDLRKAYPDAFVFTNNDMFRAGIPDFSVLYRGAFYGIEGKFIKDLPKRTQTKCLHHGVTGNQIEFLSNARRTENYGAVLIGMPDVAALMLEIKNNYTLEELLQAPRFAKIRGHWQVTNFFDTIRGAPYE